MQKVENSLYGYVWPILDSCITPKESYKFQYQATHLVKFQLQSDYIFWL